MSTAVSDSGKTIALRKMQDTVGRTSLFRLPAELRLMTWKLLIPGRRVLKARSSGAQMDPRRGDDRRFVFGFDCKVSQPILAQICAESRQFLLQDGHGQFIFGLEGETGLWWGPEDVLLFDRDWSVEWSTPSLDGLRGLNRVKNIALDSIQAIHIYYKYEIAKRDETSQDDTDDSDQEHDHEDDNGGSGDSNAEPVTTVPPRPQRITLGYWSRPDMAHFLDYFPALKKLMLRFARPSLKLGGECRYYHPELGIRNWLVSDFLDCDCACYVNHAEFDRDSTDMSEVIDDTSRLKRLWMWIAGPGYPPQCFYDPAYTRGNDLFDFCTGSSSTESPHLSYSVTTLDMIDNKDWAF